MLLVSQCYNNHTNRYTTCIFECSLKTHWQCSTYYTITDILYSLRVQRSFEHGFGGSPRKTKISVCQKTMNMLKNSIPHIAVYHKTCGIIFIDVIRLWHPTLSYNDRGQSHFSCDWGRKFTGYVFNFKNFS